MESGGHITFKSKDSVAKEEEVILPSNQKILWQRKRKKKKGGHITFKSKDSVVKAEKKKVRLNCLQIKKIR